MAHSSSALTVTTACLFPFPAHRADNTYEIQIDGDAKAGGSLYDDWDFLAPREIADPNQTKPEDWVDEAQMPDPSDVKPDGYDNIPRHVPDPGARRPDDVRALPLAIFLFLFCFVLMGLMAFFFFCLLCSYGRGGNSGMKTRTANG